VTVHVDDARSTGCSIADVGEDDSLVPRERGDRHALCREQLVVDADAVPGD
jgi:hypothetical protein